MFCLTMSNIFFFQLNDAINNPKNTLSLIIVYTGTTFPSFFFYSAHEK